MSWKYEASKIFGDSIGDEIIMDSDIGIVWIPWIGVEFKLEVEHAEELELEQSIMTEGIEGFKAERSLPRFKVEEESTVPWSRLAKFLSPFVAIWEVILSEIW